MKKYLMRVLVSFGSTAVGLGLLIPAVTFAGAYLFVDSSTGYVGLGNTTPQTQLDVSGTMYSRLVTATSSTINWNAGNVQQMTLTNSPTFTFANAQAGGLYTLILNQDGTGGRLVTWPGNVLWPNGTTPTLTSTAHATDTVSFVYDGANFLGTYATNFQPKTNSISFDASSSGSATSNTVTVSHTVSGSDPILIVAVWAQDGGSDIVTGVTYNSVSMTQVQKINGGNTGDSLYVYELVGPSTGTHNIVVSANTSAYLIEVGGVSYNGAAQSGQPDTSTTGGASSGNTSVTTSLTTLTNNDWTVLVSKATASSQIAGAGTTLRNDFSGNLQAVIFDSNGPIHPAGLTSLTASMNSGTAAFDTIMVAIKP